MSDLFFYGTLRHLPLLELVLGRLPEVTPAVLPDHAVVWAKGQAFPLILSRPGTSAEGLLVRGLSEEDRAALDYYEGGFAYALRPVTVSTSEGAAQAEVYFPETTRWEPGAPWSLEDWADRWGGISMRAAREVLDRRGSYDAREVAGMLPFFRARAWANEIAAEGAPQTLRRASGMEDVDYQGLRGAPYRGFFRIDPFRLRYRRFDGAWSAPMDRECFIAFDVSLVLPYDPVLDKVLLIEQMRFGPIHRSDPAPWVLEAVAGVIDAGETPEEAARRETVEEAGLDVRELLPASRGYASPGYTTEFYHAFVGLCDLSGRDKAIGGLDEENEDIRSHVIPFDQAMELVDSGEINALPLAMLINWVAARRDKLRAR
ncbi:gamma-glutamylcyclotransferase [Mameliella sediminis]|uniref:gamma-glutamylcyclotransferase n=1 Tax=Mameliella sediminis TaxID=2836866 RepID=UPI001C4751AD|nr:gamma-glutamylcyclotransferase [Mameliella sediminis]MBV7392751.1 gamma-glutamylcyclotransferase [Mameliella sediminis]